MLESTKMDFIRLKMNYSKRCSWWRFPQRVSINPSGSWRVSDVLVCLIPNMYVETCSPVLGPAVLRYGNDVVSCHIRICQGLTQKSGLGYTSSVWPWPGVPKVRICTLQRTGLRQVAAAKAVTSEEG